MHPKAAVYKKEMQKEVKGYLTIYLALSLTALLAVIMALFAGIRKNTLRMEEELALDTAGWSALAEYHQELFKQYDLLFIDTSYGSSYPAVEAISEHVKYYANRNLQDTCLIEGRVKQIGIQEASVATDNGGTVLERQIIEYMDNYLGIEGLERIFSEYELTLPGQITDESELLKQRDENEARLDSEPPPVKKVTKSKYNPETKEVEEYEEEEVVPIENPADRVNSLRNAGVLNLVVKEPDKLSSNVVAINEYVSHRAERMQGTGMLEGKVKRTSILSDMKRRVLLQEYIFQKFGYFGHKKEGANLEYQVEYLLGKKDSDIENLKTVVHKLLLFREAANAVYLYNDAQKQAEIAAMASGVAAVTLAPYLQPMLEVSILFAWAYVESLQDVKLLLEGGRIPVMKTAADWHTGLNSILDFENSLVSRDSSTGLNYQQHLNMFLYLENKQELLFSMMDVMEMDIRKTDCNENFRMDGCVSGFRVSVEFEGYDDICSFDRIYQY